MPMPEIADTQFAMSTLKRYNKSTLFSTKFSMTTITLQDIKTHGAKAISDEKVMYLIVNSKPKSVLVPPRDYEMLMQALEDVEDMRAIEERRGEKTIGWEEVFPKKKR